MTSLSSASDFDLLATAANYIKKDLEKETFAWSQSPFEWVLHIPPGTKGKLGKQLVYQWCALKGLSVDRSPDSQADMLINGHRIEVKFSTLWKDGFYKFQQFRDQDYGHAVCLGISPFEAHCWVISKALLLKYVIGHLGQHTGLGSQETSWLSVYPHNPPEWLAFNGGTLEQAFVVLSSLKPKR